MFYDIEKIDTLTYLAKAQPTWIMNECPGWIGNLSYALEPMEFMSILCYAAHTPILNSWEIFKSILDLT